MQAAATWIEALSACAAVVQWGAVELYFVSLPGWCFARLLDAALSWLWQRRASGGEAIPAMAGATSRSSSASGS